MLAVAPPPRRAVAVHRGDREELHGLRVAMHPVLDVRAADRRRALRPQGQRPVRAVREGVHLLLHDVGARARRAREECRVLEDRCHDPPVAVQAAQPLDLARDALPAAASRPGRRRACRAAARFGRSLIRSTPLLAPKVGEKRVSSELLAERRRRPVSGIDDRLRRIRVDESADRVEQRLPVASWKVRAADRAGEEDVSREQGAVDCERQMAGRMTGYGERRRSVMPASSSVSPPYEQDVGRPGTEPHAGRCERARLLEQRELGPRRVARARSVPSARSARPSTWSK